MKYLMGSCFFFNQYEDFKSHDIDYIELRSTIQGFEKSNILNIRGQGTDCFIVKKKNKKELIQDALNSQLAMVVGKFLIPDFNKAINFTIEDLPLLQPLIDRLDDKHKYEEIIYNAYLTNNDFILTEEQRLAAYKSYKEARKHGH